MRESNTQVESVKELRALHYSLFIFSCMLIVAVAATKDLQLSKALTQITQIQELTHNWDKMRRKLFLDRAYSKNKIFKPDVSVGVLFNPILDADRIEDVIAVDQNEITSFNAWQFQPQIMQNPPSTLAEFRTWWNTLHTGLTIYSPIKIEPPLFFDEDKTCRITVSHKWTNAVSNDESWGDCWIGKRTEGDVGSKVSWSDLQNRHRQLNPKNTLEVVYLDLYLVDDGEFHRTVKVELPFALSPTKVDETEMQKIYSDWRPGDYNESFPELLGASTDLDNIQISSAFDRIKEMQSKGDDVIEAFDIRIPANYVTRLGGAVLISAQIYLLIQLLELRRKINTSDPAWQVAWIAIYKSWIPFGVAILSACAVPVIAGCIVGDKFRIEGHPHWQLVIQLSIPVLGLALGAITAYQFRLLRRKALSAF